MARDKVAEIEALRSRGFQHLTRGNDAFEQLCEWWKSKEESDNVSDQLIIKLVTIIKVTVRTFVNNIIDREARYAEKIPELLKKNEVKLDFVFAQALQNKRVTLGQIVSHSLSLSRIENVYAALKCIIGEDILLKSNKIASENQRSKQPPETTMISDIAKLQSTIARIFEIRNIIVHELPDKQPYLDTEIDEFIRHAGDFINAILQVALVLIYPRYFKIGSIEDAKEADARYAEENEAKLDKTIAIIGDNKSFQEAQDAWKDYRIKQSRYVSEKHGTIKIKLLEGVYYDEEFSRLTLIRIRELTDIT